MTFDTNYKPVYKQLTDINTIGEMKSISHDDLESHYKRAVGVAQSEYPMGRSNLEESEELKHLKNQAAYRLFEQMLKDDLVIFQENVVPSVFGGHTIEIVAVCNVLDEHGFRKRYYSMEMV